MSNPHPAKTPQPTKNRSQSAIALASLSFAGMLAPMLAHAQQAATGSVQVYGLVGIYVDSLRRSDMKTSLVQEGSGGLTTSFLGFRGNEALGGGLTAVFKLESFFQSDTGAQGRNATDGLFSRNASVGLSGDFGAITLGRQTNPTYFNMQLVNPFGSSVVFSPLVVQTFVAPYGGAIIGDTVWNNSVMYTTPAARGLSGSVIYGLGEVAGHMGTDNLGLHLTYVNGPATAVFSAQRARIAAVAPSSAQYTYLAGGAYDFKVVKAFAAVATTNSNVVSAMTHTYQLGVDVPVSAAGSVQAAWAHTNRSAPAAASTERNTSTVAYDYRFSRRTDVYAVVSVDKLTANSSGNTYGVGMRHSF
jgi:predicted porin